MLTRVFTDGSSGAGTARRRSFRRLAAMAVLGVAAMAPASAHEGHEHEAGGPDYDEASVVPVATAPALAVGLSKDPAGGWALDLKTTNFTFSGAPEGTTPSVGKGYAVLYVDGKQAARIDTAAYHLDALPEGVRRVEVDLVDDAGHIYASDAGKLAAARYDLLVRQPDADFPAPSQTFEIAMKGGALADPANDTLNVTQGGTVAVHWSTDNNYELHFHVYDVAVELVPGVDSTMLFPADIPGRFPVEVHDQSDEHTAFYIQVMP